MVYIMAALYNIQINFDLNLFHFKMRTEAERLKTLNEKKIQRLVEILE